MIADASALRRTRPRAVGPVTPASSPRRTVVRLWLPLTPLLILLSPLPILAIPILYLVPPFRGVNVARGVFVLGRTLLALSGTQIDVDTHDALVRIRCF